MKTVKGYAPEIQRGLTRAVDLIVSTGARRATKFISPNFVVSAAHPYQRRRGRHSPGFERGKNVYISVKIGRPNHLERAFIKKALAAGEPFPVRKVQLRFPSQRKAA